MKKIGICLPSFNESKNILNLINEILTIKENIIICVVDDNSPDNTYKLLLNKYQNNEKVIVLKRDFKNGRGSAVWEGFKLLNSEEKDIEIFVEMDCDFSHSVHDLKKGIKLFKSDNCDVLLGSRYPEGQIENWPFIRRIFSFLSNQLIRALLDKNIHDYTNGFRFYNKKALNLLLKNKPKNKGFIFLSESLGIFLVNKLIIKSFPIFFKNRIRGESNTNIIEILNSLKGIMKIKKDYNKWKNLKE
tara:strand:- start:1759 stop:2493 length:735 start_codon:yes stop_codon:yes gene_type:complete